MTLAFFVLLLTLLGNSGPHGEPHTPLTVDPLRPDTVLLPPDGPRAVVLEAPGAPVLALRLHIPFREGGSEAGAGEILRRIGLERGRNVAHRVGARLEGGRTATGIVYTVTGPPSDFDHLVWVLRTAISEPDVPTFNEVRDDLRQELERRGETPTGTLAALLRIRAVPQIPPVEGTSTSLASLTHVQLLERWRETHRRDALSVVVVGPVPPEAILAGLQDLGRPPPAEEVPTELEEPESAAPEPSVEPEVIRHWYGEAYRGFQADDPRTLVAAKLLAFQLREGASAYEVGVDLWEVGEEVVFLVSGAAYAGDAGALRSRVQGIRSETLESLTDERVSTAVTEARRDVLGSIRTPWGMAELVGKRMEGGGGPEAGSRFLERLGEVDRAAMEETLQGLVGVEVRSAEILP